MRTTKAKSNIQNRKRPRPHYFYDIKNALFFPPPTAYPAVQIVPLKLISQRPQTSLLPAQCPPISCNAIQGGIQGHTLHYRPIKEMDWLKPDPHNKCCTIQCNAFHLCVISLNLSCFQDTSLFESRRVTPDKELYVGLLIDRHTFCAESLQKNLLFS